MMINCAMKKITITSLAVLAMFAISCEKNDVTNDNKVNETPEVTLPKEYVSLTFGTNTEELATKTTYNQGEIEWTAGDKVKVLFNGGTNETEAASSGEATTFGVSVPSDATSIYFAYPSTESVSLNDGAVTLTIPAETDGAFVNANYMVASALPTDEAITFYHAGSIFKVVVEDATITKAVITGNKGEALAGTVTYTFNEEGIEYGEASETSTSLTMNFNGAGTYYASALPGLTLEKGATIKFFRGENPAGGNCVSSAIPVKRACVASFGKDVEMCNRYVSTTGTGEGNGRTAAAAWNLSQFADFVSNKTSMSSEKLAALNGLTVHLAAGTYNLPSILDFKLGSNVVTLNIVGEDGAVLNGNNHQILVQNQGDRDNTTVIFDNITFSGGVASESGGAIKHRDGTLVFKNCTFSGNKTTQYGGVFNIYNTAVVIAENCRFYKNTSEAAGGVVHISDAKASASFKDCYFGDGTDANQNSAKNGGVFSFYHGNVTVEGCTFNNNKATEAAGAIFFSSSSTITVNITSSSFLKNSAGTRGGVVAIDGDAKFTLTSCLFDSNTSADLGGAIAGIGNDPSIKVNQCVFKDNKAKQGGAIANHSLGATYYLNACVFTGNYSTNTYGTTIQFDNTKINSTTAYGTLCMNNVTFADNTYSQGASTGQQACWVNLKGITKAVLSNSTMIGQTRNSGGPITESTTNLYRFDGNVGSGHYLINNIIAQTPASGTYYSCDIQSKSVKGYYNKMSTLKNAANYTTGQGDATDYRGTSSYFGGLNYVAGANPSWDNCYWSWNGTLVAGSNKEKATLENVNNTIKTADSNFHSWLNSIGALNKDGRGKSRGNNTWPGSYDGTNN